MRPRDWMAAQSPVPCITVAVSRDGFVALLTVTRRFTVLCVPKTSSTSCDQAIFVDQATDASLSSDAVVRKVDRFG